jgi:NAD(P)-dependent dehydrogenase (short-subunit alcohol dehydrogenase family)
MKAKMAFCASKAALDAAVRCLSVELAPQGIRVNTIQKGSVDVDVQKAHIQDVKAVRGEEATNENQAPLGVVKAEEIAETVVFLLSDAVKTMTGTTVIIDGGYTALRI